MKPELFIRNNKNYEKTVLIVAVVHGNEPQGEIPVREYLKMPENFGKNRLLFIPRLNFTNTKNNKNNVDLNRNFPTKNWKKLPPDHKYYGGDLPNSEDETRFLVNLIEKYKFDAILTLHAPFKIVNYDCNKNINETLKIAKVISEVFDYPIQKDIGYETPGSFGTYCGVERDIPTVTLEISVDEDEDMLIEKMNKIFHYLEFDF